MATGNSLIPVGGRWIASGRTAQGSLINATLTRSGDRLELDAQFDHRGNTSYYPWMISQYSKSCSEKASGKSFSCWFTGDVSTSSPTQPGAQVRGTLPNLTFEAHNLIGRVTLTFRPAP
jgi:hypothetical protein